MPERYLGRTLGKFRVDAIIGSGGFAWVYKAYDAELDVPLALKVLRPQYAGDEQFEERFRREASTAARLRHPNIVKIFAVGKDGDAVYFAMDYLPQGLVERLDVVPTLPEAVLIRMGIDVASAIGYAHREGVVHRDIKIDNILFDEHGNAIVADFGIARAVTNYAKQTGTNMVVGTPQYFSPEQARGLPLDGRADIYSLGVTLYRAATGVLPFNGDDWYEIARQHVEDRPARPRSHNSSLTREFERVVLRCLEKDPAARFETGEALAHALAALSPERSDTIAMRSTPIHSSEATTGPSISPGAQRTRRIRIAAAVLILGSLALGLTLHALSVHRRRHASPSAAVQPSPPSTVAVAPPLTPESVPTPVATPLLASHATRPAPRAAASPSADTSQTTVTLFGTVRINATPIGASYTLRSMIDGRVLKGLTPLDHPLSVPVGAYAITIAYRYCATYQDTLHVSPTPSTNVRVRLVCGN